MLSALYKMQFPFTLKYQVCVRKFYTREKTLNAREKYFQRSAGTKKELIKLMILKDNIHDIVAVILCSIFFISHWENI